MLDLGAFVAAIRADIKQARQAGVTGDTLMEIPIGDMDRICEAYQRMMGGLKAVDLRAGESVEVIEGEPCVACVHGRGLLDE